MKKLLVILMLGMFLLSFTSAYIPLKQSENFEFSFTSNNATSCQVTTANTPYGKADIYQNSTKNGQTFYNNILGGNFSVLGTYCLNIVCTDGINIENGDICRDVTFNGKDKQNGGNNLSYIVSWMIIMVLIYYFLARKGGDEKERSIGRENLGWFLIFLTSAIGMLILEDGTYWGFLIGAIGIIISLMKLNDGFGDW